MVTLAKADLETRVMIWQEEHYDKKQEQVKKAIEAQENTDYIMAEQQKLRKKIEEELPFTLEPKHNKVWEAKIQTDWGKS